MSDTEMMTIAIQIGNSDDKLSQGEWSNYVGQVHDKIREYAREIHFFGGSPNWYAWQNACFVFEIDEVSYISFCSELKFVREFFEQDSIAVIKGGTVFI